MKDLRPIALCNVLYKIMAKVLSNRLKMILPVLITENQSAFVPGRNISDKVLVAFEIIHHMKRKQNGSYGEVALKLDISKAYDRVDWLYLKRRMQIMVFSAKWVSWVMMCVNSVQYNICFNSSQLGPIIPIRGLRQGDPLSPYLFLLCVEGLSHLIRKAEYDNSIHGCKISNNAPAITHLLFADDSFLFFRAENSEAHRIKDILNLYELLSGQAVNFQKSGVFFCSNVRRDKQLELSGILGVWNDLTKSKYLGLPSLIGRSKKLVFSYLKDKMWKKIQSWSTKTKLLSRAGKAVLIKSVAQTIPSYTMSCFLLPKSLCQELERVMNRFWWKGSTAGSKGIHWLSWDKMCTNKTRGGLGFRNLYGFNLAMLGKQVWNFINNPNTLVARVFRAKYYPDSNILSAVRGGGSSFVWSGIYAAKEEIKNGFRWVLGDGMNIAACTDLWLKGKSNFMVENKDYGANRNIKVCNLFKSNSRHWDEEKIVEVFEDADVKAILETRIPQHEVGDRVVWRYTKEGQYSVKSGYHVWQESNLPQVHNAESFGWRRLWNLKIPPKVKKFLWRFCRNIIPVRNILHRRNYAIPILCPMCGTDVEHMAHVFFDCAFASQCWQEVGINFNMWEVENVTEWLLDKLSSESYENLSQIAMTLWGIWFFRNKKVWENKVVTSQFAMEWSFKQLVDWRAVTGSVNQLKETTVKHSQRIKAKWITPDDGCLKLNVDANVVPGSSSFAIGMILRDHNGQYLGGKVMNFDREASVFEAEMVGIEEALSWIMVRTQGRVCLNQTLFLQYKL